MSGEDSGVDAGSNDSNDSVCMSLASSDSDYGRDDLNIGDNHNDDVDEIAVIDININRVNQNQNQIDSNESTQHSDFGNNCCESQMNDSSYMATSPPSTSSPIASTSSASTSHPIQSVSSHCHYESLCSSSTSSHNQMTNSSNVDNRIVNHFLQDFKPEDESIGVPNDYSFSNEDQHEFYPKIRNHRQKAHEIRRKHIFKDIAGERLLRRAANSNDFETVERLLNEGIDPQSCDERNRTALHFASCKGNTRIARLLLEKGANPNQKDAIGNTALHLAACTNNIEVITLLLSAGTDINSLDNSGRTPLHLAQSKLKMIQSMQRSDFSINSDQLKSEVLQVIEMMSIYWHRSGKSAELELLTAFTNRLHLSKTCEEVGTDVKDLLTSLSHLTL